MSSRRSFLLFLLVLSCLAIIPQARGIIRQEDDTGDTQQDSEESASGAESPKPDASLGSGPHLDDGASDVPAGSESDSATNKTSPDTSLENSSVLSSLYINTVKPGLGSPVTERVFKDGALHGLFNSCRTVAVDSSAPDAECFLDDQYNDRLTFEITYGVPGSDIESAFKANPPSLELLGDSSDSSSASISEYHVRAPTSNAEVTVKYYCKRDADSVIDLELKIQFGRDSDSIVTIMWKKNCSSGVNPQLEFGYTTDDHKTGEKLRHPFGSEADRYVVPPSDVSTEVYAKLQQAGAQQEFLAPFVVSKDPSIVGVVVRGNHPNGGILQGLEMTEFQISYECVRKGSSDISVSVGIPPFDNVTSIWEKGTCSNGESCWELFKPEVRCGLTSRIGYSTRTNYHGFSFLA